MGISLDAADPATPVQPPTVVYGSPIALYGQLVPESGADVSTQAVSIHRIDRGTSILRSTGTATTDAGGNFSALYTPTYSALYQADWAGTTDCAPKMSAENAFVAVRMGIATSKVGPAAGSIFTIRGSVRPNKAGKTVILRWGRADSRYPHLAYTYLTLDSHSNFSKNFISNSPGSTYIFRAQYRPLDQHDQLNVGNTTPFVRVTIG